MKIATRSRWAAVGAAVAITLGAGGVSLTNAGAPTPDNAPVFISLSSPCRVVDTRAADTLNIGPKNTPVGAGETAAYTIQITGSNGQCTGDLAIPADALGVALNVTAINNTSRSHFRVYPADAAVPNTSNLNFNIGQTPIANKVDVGLSSSGQIKVFNFAGTTDVAVDVFGYYIDHNHDGRYYTENEIDALLADKAGSPDVYTTAQVDAAIADAATFDRIVVVSGAGTPTENGDALETAIAAAAAAAPTVDSPLMILLEPGLYERASYTTLPGYVTLAGSGRDATRIVDTDGSGTPITNSGQVVLRDFTVEQSGTSSTVILTSDATLDGVRVIGNTSSITTGGLRVDGASVTAHDLEVVGDPAGSSVYGITVLGGGSLTGDRIVTSDVAFAMSVGTSSSTGSATLTNSSLIATIASLYACAGDVTINGSTVNDQIGMGGSPYSSAVDVEINNSVMECVFFNGASSTGTRTITISNTTMNGNVAGGFGDGFTVANLYNVQTNGTVEADIERCYSVIDTTGFAFYADTCP